MLLATECTESRLSLADSNHQYTAEVTGGSVENVNRIAAGQMDLGFSMAREPPVALAAYAAAGLAGSRAMQTAVTALGLASAGFIVPFVFIYDPALILVGSPLAVAVSTAAVGLGLTAAAAAMIGYARRPLAPWERFI